MARFFEPQCILCSQFDGVGDVQVIFIDELDGLCRKRVSTEEDYTRRIKTELLRQIENATNRSVFLLGATNCPWELDSAFLRRFQKRAYVPLPDRSLCGFPVRTALSYAVFDNRNSSN